MGFFSKLWNAVRGRGFKETEDIAKAEEAALLRKQFEAAEDAQYPTQIEEKEPEVPQVEQEIPQAVEQVSNQAVDNTIENIRREREPITNLTRQLNNNIVGQAPVPVSENLNVYRTTYEKLFSEKVQDRELVQILIENRERLRHRFSINIIIMDDQGTAGNLQVSGVLPEEGNLIREYIKEGQETQYLSSVLASALGAFKSQKGAIGGSFNAYREKVTIKAIQIQSDFA